MSVLRPEHLTLMDGFMKMADVGFSVTWVCTCGGVNPVISEVCGSCFIDVALDPSTPRDHPVFLYYGADRDAETRDQFIAYVNGLIA